MAITAAKYDVMKNIKQSERLFTVRPRSSQQQDNQEKLGSPTGGGNRGVRSYIRLLTTDMEKSKSRLSKGEGFGSPSVAKYLVDSMVTKDNTKGFSDFLLTDVNVSFDEKVQITQTFGDQDVVYYFGKAPVVFNLSGLLIDDVDNGWFATFIDAYANIMRGTELARNYELLEITLPNMVLVGTIMGMQYSQNSSRDTDIPFSMKILAKQITPKMTVVASYPLDSTVQTIDFVKVSKMLGQDWINNTSNKVQSLIDKVKNPMDSSIFSTTFGGGSKNDPTSFNNQFNNLSDHIGSPIAVTDLFSKNPLSGGNISEQIGSITSSLPIPGIPSIPNMGSEGDWYGASTSSGGSGSQGASLFGGLPAAKSLGSGLGLFGGGGGDLGNFASTITAFRSSLFSPVYGVLTSITKTIKEVTGNISNLISSFTSPVNSVLRDIQNISNQATGIVKLIEGSVTNLVNLPLLTINNIHNTLSLLKNTVGVITRAPQTITQALRNLSLSGHMSVGAAAITGGGRKSSSQVLALLHSGVAYTPSSGANISINSQTLSKGISPTLPSNPASVAKLSASLGYGKASPVSDTVTALKNSGKITSSIAATLTSAVQSGRVSTSTANAMLSLLNSGKITTTVFGAMLKK